MLDYILGGKIMKNPLANKISRKDLYLATLRRVSHAGIDPHGGSIYYFGDKRYIFAKKNKNGQYTDVLTGLHYSFYDEPSLGSGDIAVSKAEPINTTHLFVNKSILIEILKELNMVEAVKAEHEKQKNLQ